MTIITKCRRLYVAFAVGLVLVPAAVVAEGVGVLQDVPARVLGLFGDPG